MPELPEAETIAQQLSALLVGRRLTGATLFNPEICKIGKGVATFPFGARVTSVTRRGKKIIVAFDDESAVLFSLGMSGTLRLRPDVLPAHTHIAMNFDGTEVIYVDPRRLGRLDPRRPATALLASRPAVDAWCAARLGPDAHTVSWTEFRKRFTGRRAPIKTLLLNQKLLAGVGNIYADETLFRARVHPQARPAALNEAALKRVHAALRRVLNTAIAACGTTFRDYVTPTGGRGDFARFLKVYGRAGQKCRRCGAKIRAIAWPAGRTTHFCPRCQPLPK